ANRKGGHEEEAGEHGVLRRGRRRGGGWVYALSASPTAALQHQAVFPLSSAQFLHPAQCPTPLAQCTPHNSPASSCGPSRRPKICCPLMVRPGPNPGTALASSKRLQGRGNAQRRTGVPSKAESWRLGTPRCPEGGTLLHPSFDEVSLPPFPTPTHRE